MASETQNPYLSQVRRLGGLEFTPQTPEAWTELGKVLKSRSKSQEHAERIIGRFLEPGAPTRCPTPGELATMAKSVPADPKLDRAELAEPCQECAPLQGCWRYSPQREGLERCGCARGMKLRAMDAARGEAPTEPRKRNSSEMQPPADWARKAAGDK